MPTLKAFWHDQRGATSIEYALIASLLTMLIVGGLSTIGTKLKAKFQPIADNLS